jgi:hypothetical protein
LEQKQLAYLSSCLDRWLTRWEMQCDAKLRTEVEKRTGTVFFKFNRQTWLQMDAQATANVLTSYVASKIMNRNEARDKLDLNPVPGGEEFENPNITVKEPSTNVDNSIKLAAGYMAAQVLFDRFLETECNRIEKATGNKNFVSWIEKTYETWQQTYESQANSLGVDASGFVSQLLQRKEQLLEACECQPEQLKERVENLVKEWRNDNP